MKLRYIASLYLLSILLPDTEALLSTGAPEGICREIRGMQNSRMKPTTSHNVSVSLVNGGSVIVGIQTEVMSATQECTVIKVDGTDLITLPCENTHGSYTPTVLSNIVTTRQNVTENNVTTEQDVPETVLTTLDVSNQSLCANHPTAGNEFCAHTKTNEISKCTTVHHNGNNISTFCSCTTLNEFLVVVLRKTENCARVTQMDDKIKIHYRATTRTGLEFDNSYYNNIPVDVQLGIRQFMRGWDIGLLGMCEGDVRKLTIPYRAAATEGEILAYPTSPHPYVVEGDTLTFEIKLIKIVRDDL